MEYARRTRPLSRQMIFVPQSSYKNWWLDHLRTKKLIQDFARVGYNILGALSKADYLLPHKSKQKNMLKFSNEGLEHANFLLMRRQFLDRLFQVEITSTMGAQYIPQWDIYAIQHKIIWLQHTTWVFSISRHALMHIFL